MKSIRQQLLLAFLAVVAVPTVAALGFFVVQSWVTQQYKSLSDTMIAEYSLVETSVVLIDAFNTRVKSSGTDSVAESDVRIQHAKTQIQQLTLFLDTHIQDTESESNYLGFKASIGTLTDQIDASLVRFEQGSIKDYVTDYDTVNKDYGFVRENGTTLVFSQLKYANSVRNAIDRGYLTILYMGLLMLLVLILGCIFFILRFANRLTRPLRSLTFAAKQIAADKMDFVIDQSILKQSNEIGILAQSFSFMEKALGEKITQLNASNKEMAIATEAVTAKNSELTRLNTLMVDRELKMIELKKELADLRGEK